MKELEQGQHAWCRAVLTKRRLPSPTAEERFAAFRKERRPVLRPAPAAGAAPPFGARRAAKGSAADSAGGRSCWLRGRGQRSRGQQGTVGAEATGY